MNKKEISEIKKTLQLNNCCLTRLCGCYVNADREKVLLTKEAFLSYPEEEMHKYLNILRKALSGKIGKNIFNMEFPLNAEYINGSQASLLHLRNSELKDDTLLEAFYDHIIESYYYPDAYFILVAHGMYDIPYVASDRREIEDGSEDVYSHIICCICPMKLSKAGLFYQEEDNSIKDKLGERMVNMPEVAFLFPAFNDRTADIHGALYYSKSSTDINAAFIEDVLGCEVPMAAKMQEENFTQIVKETFEEKCTFEIAKDIHAAIGQRLTENEIKPETLELEKEDFKKIFEDCDAQEEQLEKFSDAYDKYIGNKSRIQAENIEQPKNLEITMSGIKISVGEDELNQIEKRMIEGRNALVIPINGPLVVGNIEITDFH